MQFGNLRLEPRFLVILLAVVATMGFFLYKAFSALTLEEQPSSQGPAAAFVLPQQVEITDRLHIFSPRLPTDSEVEVRTASRKIAEALATGGADQGLLTAAGLGEPEAEQVLAAVAAAGDSDLDARVGDSLTLEAATEEEAVLSGEILLLDRQGNAPPVTLSLRFHWAPEGGSWEQARLASLEVSLPR